MTSARPGVPTATILLTAGLLLIAYLLGDVLLLVVASVVLAVGLDGLSHVLSRRLPVSRNWALVGGSRAIFASIFAVFGLSAGRLVEQLQRVGARSWISQNRGMPG